MSEDDSINETNCAEALRLKEEGNTKFKNEDYLSAIQFYTHAIHLTGLSPTDLGILYSNLCNAHVKMYNTKGEKDHLEEGIKNANKCVELRPDWYKGHFRLGQAYEAANKFEKAEKSLQEAQKLAKTRPQKDEIVDTINRVKCKFEAYKRRDVLDRRSIIHSSAATLDYIKKKTGFAFDVKLIDKWKQRGFKHGSREERNYYDCHLGHRYRGGIDGYPRDYDLAAKHFKKAADNGVADGMYSLAQMIRSGQCRKYDINVALQLLEKAATQPQSEILESQIGVANAQHALGLTYQYGEGVTKDIPKAIYWYKKAVDNDSLESANNLGKLYEMGLVDGKPNLIKAVQYYRFAAGHALRADSNAMLHLVLSFEKNGDLERALDWCRRAKANGNLFSELDEMTSRIRKRLASFNESGIPEWELLNNNSKEGLTIRERELRYEAARDPLFPWLEVRCCPLVDGKQKLTDPKRISLVKKLRKFSGKFSDCSMLLFNIRSTVPPPKEQKVPSSLAALKQVLLLDMDTTEDAIYEGRVLTATVITEVVFTGSSIAFILEDANGDAERCFVYNSPHMEDEPKVRELYCPGRQLSIMNPYMRMAARDHRPAIRVEDPSSIVLGDAIPNMFRYCCTPNATLRCGKCKNALYCGKKCQKADWRTMNHENICRPDI